MDPVTKDFLVLASFTWHQYRKYPYRFTIYLHIFFFNKDYEKTLFSKALDRWYSLISISFIELEID